MKSVLITYYVRGEHDEVQVDVERVDPDGWPSDKSWNSYLIACAGRKAAKIEQKRGDGRNVRFRFEECEP
jgi:hypothetical protein